MPPVDRVRLAELVDVLSNSTTWACIPTAIAAAFIPLTPAPITTTLAPYAPDTPPINTPRPPPLRINRYAPIWAASRPATSDIGASSGRVPSLAVTVSYAIAGHPALQQRVGALLGGGEMRYVNSTCPRRIRWYSSVTGSLTLSTRSATPHTSSALGRIRAPAAR